MTFASVTEALARYEKELTRRGIPDDHFRPGLTRNELQEIEEEIGYRLSEDVHAVWAWHNGTVPADNWVGKRWPRLIPYYHLLELRTAIVWGEAVVRAAAIGDDATPGVDRWVELAEGNDPFVIDSTDPDRPDSPTLCLVHTYGLHEIPHISVTERVNLWTAAFRSGAWTIDDDGQWRQHDDLLTDRMRALL